MFFYRTDEIGNVLQVSQDNWQSRENTDYSAVWDEAKRCPFAKNGKPRYQIVDGAIEPTADVLDIDVPEGMAIRPDGTLEWI